MEVRVVLVDGGARVAEGGVEGRVVHKVVALGAQDAAGVDVDACRRARECAVRCGEKVCVPK